MNHGCSGIWSPASASAQEDVFARQPYELGRFGWQMATATRTCWFWTAHSPQCGTTTYSFYNVVRQCLVALSLWTWGYFSYTAKGSSLAREIITAFPFAPNCYNSAFPEGLVDLKLLPEVVNRFVCAISTEEALDAGQMDINRLYCRVCKHPHQHCVATSHIPMWEMIPLNCAGL